MVRYLSRYSKELYDDLDQSLRVRCHENNLPKDVVDQGL